MIEPIYQPVVWRQACCTSIDIAVDDESRPLMRRTAGKAKKNRNPRIPVSVFSRWP